MLRFRVDGFEVCVDFGFFFAVAIALLISDELLVYSTLLACAAHEAGHFLVMILCGVKPDRLLLYGGGACVRASELSDAADLKRLAVALSGAVVNFTLFMLTLRFTPMFAAVNLVLGAFNLLPITCLDGGIAADIFARRYLPHGAYRVFCKLEHFSDCCFTAAMVIAALTSGGALMLVVPVYTIVLQLYKDE